MMAELEGEEIANDFGDVIIPGGNIAAAAPGLAPPSPHPARNLLIPGRIGRRT